MQYLNYGWDRVVRLHRSRVKKIEDINNISFAYLYAGNIHFIQKIVLIFTRYVYNGE